MTSETKKDYSSGEEVQPVHDGDYQEEKKQVAKNIRQLGQTDVVEQPPDINIHTINIIGQIEGHMVLRELRDYWSS